MGIGQALSEGTQLDEEGRHRNAHLTRLQARHGLRCPADRHRLDRDRHAERRAEGLEGRRRAAVRADGGRDRERDREGDRRARACAADDTRARLGGLRVSVQRLHHARRRSTTPLPRSLPVPGPSQVAPISSSAPGQGKAPLPDEHRRDPPHRRAARHRAARRRGPSARRAGEPRGDRASEPAVRGGSPRSPTRARSSARTRPARRARSAAT